MLNFVGMGSAFNTEKGNTSAFIKRNNNLLLIDCGGNIFHKLQDLNLLYGLENLYVIITHTHPDHVGSLGDLIFYSYYILNHKPTIFFPNRELIEGFLASIGVSTEMYNLNHSDTIEVKDTQLGKFNIEFLKVSHVDTIPAYGFTIKLDGKAFYYSGDSNDINNGLLVKFKNGQISRIYQDTCGLDYEGNSHLSLRRLCSIIPHEFRDRVYCMHLDKHITEKQIQESGFNVVNVIGK